MKHFALLISIFLIAVIVLVVFTLNLMANSGLKMMFMIEHGGIIFLMVGGS